MIPGKPFNPATEVSRRPTPEKFAHLKKWVEVVVQNVAVKSVVDLTNINQQISQVSKLFVSNIVQRTVSQLVAAYGSGFVTLQGTAAGALKVEEQGSVATKRAVISFATAASHSIVAAVTGKKIQLRSVALTVAGETNLTWKSGTTAISGAMDFGGTDEPRGISHGLGKYPLETVAGEALVLASSGAVQVSGYITYTEE